MPLESMGLTQEQQEKFRIEAKGFEVDCSSLTEEEQIKFLRENIKAPIDWQVSFETLESKIDDRSFKGFALFKKVYEAFPDICSLKEEEARGLGIYPIIHYRNFAARKWMANMNGGHIATLDQDYNGELDDICKAAGGKTNIQKLAAIGQAPLGFRSSNTEVYNLGSVADLGADPVDDDNIRMLSALRDNYMIQRNIARDGKMATGSGWHLKNNSASSIVVLDK